MISPRSSRADDDIKLAHELVEIFLQDCPRLLSDIREAVKCGDSQALGRAAHTMKGAIGYFSNSKAVEMVMQLETMGERHDLSAAPHALSELEEALDQLTPSLAAFGRSAHYEDALR